MTFITPYYFIKRILLSSVETILYLINPPIAFLHIMPDVCSVWEELLHADQTCCIPHASFLTPYHHTHSRTWTYPCKFQSPPSFQIAPPQNILTLPPCIHSFTSSPRLSSQHKIALSSCLHLYYARFCSAVYCSCCPWLIFELIQWYTHNYDTKCSRITCTDCGPRRAPRCSATASALWCLHHLETLYHIQ